MSLTPSFKHIAEILYALEQGCTNFPKSSSHHEILGARWVTIIKFHKYQVPNILSIIKAVFSSLIHATTCISTRANEQKAQENSCVQRSFQNFRISVWTLLHVTRLAPKFKDVSPTVTEKFVVSCFRTYSTLMPTRASNEPQTLSD